MPDIEMTDEQLIKWRNDRGGAWKNAWLGLINYAASHPEFGPDYLNGLAVSINGGDIAGALLADPSDDEEENMQNLPNDARMVVEKFKICFDKDNFMLDKDEANYTEEPDDGDEVDEDGERVDNE